MTVVNPDLWLESLEATLKEYVTTGLPANLYDFRMSFPSADFVSDLLPLEKTLIHFEIDDINSPPLGVGTSAEVDATFDVPNAQMDITEAFQHLVNFDVGIWASDESGGVTARLRAYRRLDDLFHGKRTLDALKTVRGIEVLNFEGGVFAVEKIQDVRTYRVMGINLDVRVFSRKIYENVPFIDSGQILQDPDLETLDGPIT